MVNNVRLVAVVLLVSFLTISTTALAKNKPVTTPTECKTAKDKYIIAAAKYGIQPHSEGDSVLNLNRSSWAGGKEQGVIIFTPETSSCTIEYKGYLAEVVVEKLNTGVVTEKMPRKK
jgi:hypothetical protein